MGSITSLVPVVTRSGHSSAVYTYSYDVRRNITAVYKDESLVASYAYDDLNQLVRENNVAANKTWVYTYDERGNILSRKTYAYTTGTLGTVQDTDTYEYFEQSSEYLWGDGLLRYDGTEYNVYDAIGNPLSYNNGSAYTFSWSNGRQLTSGTKGTTSFSYTYNADGLRTKKVVGNTTTTYYWAGSQLAAMTIDNGTTVKTMKFYYDAEGTPMCLDYNGTVYFYITNLQGDVVAISDQYGEVICYEYDAWGKIISSEYYFSSHGEVMQYNPLRYRGYIYDNETGFYYLQSRYYDPTVGRFINSDGQLNGGFLGNNMFAYCENNPVNMVDNTGEIPFFVITAAIGAVIGAVAGGIIAAQTGGNVWAGIGIGAAAGALIGTGFGMAAGAALASSITATTGAVVAGGGTLVSTVATGGVGAGASYIANNLQQATNAITSTAPTCADPIKHALKQLDASGLRPGQTEISRSRIMELVNTFDTVKAQSCVNSIGGTRYLVDGHHTTVASTILGKGTCMNMGVFTTQLPSATNIYWTKHWYEFWKTVIKIIE